MANKDEILMKFRSNVQERYDMPDLSDIAAIRYSDPLSQFMNMTRSVGGNVVEVEKGRDLNTLIRELYPDAKEIASNLPEISIATRNPDSVGSAQELNGTDVGIVRGEFGVAENACIWVPQTMKEKVVLFISENLVILLNKKEIVNNMHEAYARLSAANGSGDFERYGYGAFISGPSKTADIAQVLVMGAQAARSATVLLLDE